MIVLLLSYGIRIVKIVEAHEYLRDETAEDFPFATRTLWTDDPEWVHVYAKINDVLVAADKSGQIPFVELLKSKIVKTSNMIFSDGGRAVSWEPSRGVELHPGFLSGAPRIKGRRIQTSQIAGMLDAGTSKEDVMWWLDISDSEIEDALRRERSLQDSELVSAA